MLACCGKSLTDPGRYRQTAMRVRWTARTKETSVARPTKAALTKPAAAAKAPVRTKRQPVDAAPEPVASPSVKTRAARSTVVPPMAVTKPTSGRGKTATAAFPAAVATRVPPPSKGELRAQIEKLEAANATLKAKSRETNRTAKAAARRIAELEEQVVQLQAAAAKTTAPVASPAETKTPRRGRPPGRTKAIDPGDAVPPGVAVQKPEPLDEEAAAARDALEDNLSGN